MAPDDRPRPATPGAANPPPGDEVALDDEVAASFPASDPLSHWADGGGPAAT